MKIWSISEDEALRRMALAGVSDTMIAAHLGRKIWEITSRRCKIGIKFRVRKSGEIGCLERLEGDVNRQARIKLYTQRAAARLPLFDGMEVEDDDEC